MPLLDAPTMTMNPAASTASTPAFEDEEYSLACHEALLAGTLALMTGFAHGGNSELQRDAMAQRVACHLHDLARMDGMTPHFRRLLSSLEARWQQQVQSALHLTPDTPPRALWLPEQERMQ